MLIRDGGLYVVSLKCDGPHCTVFDTCTGKSRQDANLKLLGHGWVSLPHGRHLCAECDRKRRVR